jgi:uncharacterized protein YqhQ
VPKGEYLQYGGQAIIEGVMMRSPRYFAIACRAPNGEIVLQTEAIEKTWIGRQKWLKYPFLRGSLALVDSMALGTKAMRFSSAVQMDPKYADPAELEAAAVGGKEPAKETPKHVQDVAIGGALVFSFVFGLALFNFLPNYVADLTRGPLGLREGKSGTTTNVIAEIVKATIFFGYIGLIGLLPDIREVFRYHGAEHKAINALEHDRPLNIENCQNESRIHPRCGTSFAIIVLLVGFVIFAFLPRYPLGESASKILNVSIRIAMELCILPFIAGISYELLRFAGKFRDQVLVNAAFQPGMWSQRLTTREPEPKHVEVAIAALNACLEAEEATPGKTPKENEDVIESAPPLPATGL